jgi:RNA polymerase sigma factor (sigma-70 family)
MTDRDPSVLTTPASSRSLTELVADAQSRDSSAWNELVERLGNLVWSVTRSYGIPPHDAVDISQVTWLQLARRLDRINDPERLGLWLATTTRRQCMTYLSSMAGPRRAEPYESLETRASGSVSTEEAVVAREESRQLWDAVNRLPDGCRALIRLFLCDPEPSYAEVAAALDMPVNSVGPRRQRCIKRLKTEVTTS